MLQYNPGNMCVHEMYWPFDVRVDWLLLWQLYDWLRVKKHECMMTSSNGNIFRVTGHLCGEFTGHQWIPRTKASDAELWYFLWSTPESGWWFETPSRPFWRYCNGIGKSKGIKSQQNAKTICTIIGFSCMHFNHYFSLSRFFRLWVFSTKKTFELWRILWRMGKHSFDILNNELSKNRWEWYQLKFKFSNITSMKRRKK